MGRTLSRTGYWQRWLTVVLAIMPVAFAKISSFAQPQPRYSVPLGGIGAGYFRIASDGRVQNLVLQNNWQHPVAEAPGSFAAISVHSGSSSEALAVQTRSEYRMHTADFLDFTPQFPEAVFVVHSAALDAMKVRVTVRWFSPLIPGDISQSCVPAAACIVRFENQSNVQVSASAALSWEFASANPGKTNVLAEAIPAQQGFFGVKLSESKGAVHQALLARPENGRALVTTATWDATTMLPAWWSGFARDGVVVGVAGAENAGRVAAVTAAQVSLKPRESINLPFCAAWNSGPLVAPGPGSVSIDDRDYGHLWERRTTSAVETARWLLDNWASTLTLTEEWQKRIVNSNLPADVSQELIAGAAPLITSTLLTGDGRFTALPAASDYPDSEYLHARSDMLGLLLSFYPQLASQELMQLASQQLKSGAIPWERHDWWTRLGAARVPETPSEPNSGQPLDVPENMVPNSQPAFTEPDQQHRIEGLSELILNAYRVVKQTDNLIYLKNFLPLIGRCLEPWLSEPNRAEIMPSPLRNRFALALRAAARLADIGEKHGYEWLKSVGSPAASAIAGLELAARMRRLSGRCNTAADTIDASRKLPAAQPVTVAASAPLSADIAPARVWDQLLGIEGFGLDLQESELQLTTPIPPTMRSLNAPLFAPTFVGTVQYRPNAHGGTTSLRIDRTIIVNPLRSLSRRIGPSGNPQLVLKRIRVAGPPLKIDAKGMPLPVGTVEAHVSLGPNTLGASVQLTQDGTLVIEFAAPLVLVTGDRLEIDVHAVPR